MKNTLIEFWKMVAGVYGVAFAAIVICAVLGVALYLGLTPGQIVEWMGK